ncbi:hypothetical protein O3G_MSEX003968 [Manduca sexta]|uniref:Ig-like domain-containing protein n=1 Tax=Manduca sexta TaxID=7130 RepID=A0A922CGP9_MANSE|nr:hypothetical protein O3G_MSEX003968 [Manduca sexta]KAG6445492.1 hypothetical protein O3G_MSEX003968 [Manduca sexta]
MASEDTIIDADTGSTVIFDCKVSWLRVYDNENLELLTLDLDTHTADARYRVDLAAPAIRMSKEAFLETGETLSLKCAVLNLYPGDTVPEMHWYRGNTTVSLDEVRGGVLIETDHLSLTSHLQVARLRVEDAGNYTCALEAPLRMRTVARVHVLQGSSLAELQSGVKTTTSYFNLLLTSLILAFGTLYGDIR